MHRKLGRKFLSKVRFCAALLPLAIATAAQAETIQLRASLDAASEVPPTTGAGTGRGQFTYDTETKQLTYAVRYVNLSGPAIAAHIHGPALAGANAAVVVDMLLPTSPIRGTSTLSDAQATELLAGHYYVNVHTDANKAGEIRGQITRAND